MSAPRWTTDERAAALERAEREGVDLLVVGGGITGAGVLRDAASRGLRALLVERGDFAAGTSSRSSKLVHGGLRYLAEGQVRLTREACRERDRLLRQNPNLVRPIDFLAPAWTGSRVPLWKLRAGMWAYAALANFRRSARFRMLGPEEVAAFSRDLRQEGLRGAALYRDGQVDDARLVLEVLKSARRLGAEAASHAEVVELLHGEGGRVRGARVLDRLGGGPRTLRAHVVVNAAGPAVERLRALDRPEIRPELRPAKGVHVVIPRERVHAEGVVTFEAADGRPLFLIPWDEVALLGTTDTFTDEVDEPVARIEEVHYLLEGANRAFPRAALTTNDIRCAFAGVRPLAAPEAEGGGASGVSREDRVTVDPSGLVSVAGGKLTTFRAMGERVVRAALRELPAERRRAAGPSRTRSLPLREDAFDAAELEEALARRFGLAPHRAAHLVRAWGADAEPLLAEARPEERRPVGSSHYLYAEIPWSFRTECPVSLCDLLERRLRLALFAIGQGLPELERIAEVAARAAGWDAERARAEAVGYSEAVRRRYQIAPPAAPRRAEPRTARRAA